MDVVVEIISPFVNPASLFVAGSGGRHFRYHVSSALVHYEHCQLVTQLTPTLQVESESSPGRIFSRAETKRLLVKLQAEISIELTLIVPETPVEEASGIAF